MPFKTDCGLTGIAVRYPEILHGNKIDLILAGTKEPVKKLAKAPALSSLKPATVTETI